MRRLWLRMVEIYGQLWTDKYGDDWETGAGQTWAKGLAGLADTEIGRGVAACVTRGTPWAPSLPEFRLLCMGIPSKARVAFELKQGDRSPFTCMVLARLDSHAYRASGAKDAERLLRDAYELAVEARMSGEPLPEPRLALPETVKTEPKPADPETVKAHLAEIGKYLGVSK
ncbi:hypothetical protein [Aquilutibacter rugosus]|uniref:hypothetical protein n=1 Tax=Aquilutibacter rugosus TaxID=3115820 RepID=UPI002F41FF4E